MLSGENFTKSARFKTALEQFAQILQSLPIYLKTRQNK